MDALDPKAAAALIKPEWDKDPPSPEPEDRHSLSYLEEVCDALGVEKNAFNVAHVARLMAKLNIEQHHPDEFPKAVNFTVGGKIIPAKWPAGSPKAGTEVVLHNEDDQAEWDGFNLKEPEPIAPVAVAKVAPIPVVVVEAPPVVALAPAPVPPAPAPAA